MNRILKTAFLIGTLAASASISAMPYLQKDRAFAHLEEVNAQWLKQPNAAPVEIVSFTSDVERIQYHLVLVEEFLSRHTPAGFTREALAKRKTLLNELKDYAAAKNFPVNTGHPERTPYFIDDFGTHCAVGFLISASGHDVLAQKINREYRFSYIHAIKTEGLHTWAFNHGFTIDELAWIQPGYPPNTKFAAIGEGTNGPINGLAKTNWDSRVVFHGKFTEVNGIPCLNVGFYEEGQLQCFGGGIDGRINDITNLRDKIIVCGEIYHENKVYPIAFFDGSSWTYQEVPGREGAIGSSIFSPGYIEIALSHPAIPGKQELWYERDGTWEKKITVDGVILDMEASSYGRVYAGAFKSVTIHRAQGDELISANNVVFKENYEENWYSAGSEISDTVMVVKDIGSTLYFGGVCSYEPGRSEVCLTRYMNRTLQPLILASNLSLSDSSCPVIHTLDLYTQTQLLIGGRIYFVPMIGIIGRNLVGYDLVHSKMVGMGILDGNVMGIARFGDDWFLGGHFNMGEIHHIARIDNSSSIPDEMVSNFSVYPVPAMNMLNITLDKEMQIKNTKVTDLLGRNVSCTSVSRTGPASFSMDVSSLNAGMYILTLQTADNRHCQKTFSVKE